MPSAKVNMLYFAQARDLAGTEREDIVLTNPASTRTIVLRAAKSHPGLLTLERVIRVAVNHQVLDGTVVLEDGDEVALLPPVMGG